MLSEVPSSAVIIWMHEWVNSLLLYLSVGFVWTFQPGAQRPLIKSFLTLLRKTVIPPIPWYLYSFPNPGFSSCYSCFLKIPIPLLHSLNLRPSVRFCSYLRSWLPRVTSGCNSFILYKMYEHGSTNKNMTYTFLRVMNCKNRGKRK